MFDENLSKNIKALAYEKSIDVERVFKALEDALATAARKYYKTREPMETVIDRTSGFVRRRGRHAARAGRLVASRAYGIRQRATHRHEQLKPRPNDATLEDVDEALSAGATHLLADNMSLDDLRETVERSATKATVEASGGVTLDTIGAIARTGVDFISVGALTHSAPALDLSLLLYT